MHMYIVHGKYSLLIDCLCLYLSAQLHGITSQNGSKLGTSNWSVLYFRAVMWPM